MVKAFAISYRIPATGYRLPATGYRLPTTSWLEPKLHPHLNTPRLRRRRGTAEERRQQVAAVVHEVGAVEDVETLHVELQRKTLVGVVSTRSAGDHRAAALTAVRRCKHKCLAGGS